MWVWLGMTLILAVIPACLGSPTELDFSQRLQFDNGTFDGCPAFPDNYHDGWHIYAWIALDGAIDSIYRLILLFFASQIGIYRLIYRLVFIFTLSSIVVLSPRMLSGLIAFPVRHSPDNPGSSFAISFPF